MANHVKQLNECFLKLGFKIIKKETQSKFYANAKDPIMPHSQEVLTTMENSVI